MEMISVAPFNLRSLRELVVSLFVLISLIIGLDVYALEVREARVLSDLTASESQNCKFRLDSATAAVESALRANRITVSHSPTTQPTFYVSVGALESSNNHCVVTFSLQVRVFAGARVQLTKAPKKEVFSVVELCREAAIIQFQKHEIQAIVNDALKEYVDLCLSTISKIN